MWLCEDELEGKTAHFRLPSASLYYSHGRYFLQVTGHRTGLQVTVAVTMIKQPKSFINDNRRPKNYYFGQTFH